MLLRRVSVGFFIVLCFLLLCYLDFHIGPYSNREHRIWLPRGVILIPCYLFCVFFLSREVIRILNAAGLHPLSWTVYLGNSLIVINSWLANVFQQYHLEVCKTQISQGGWHWAATASLFALLSIAIAVMISFSAEMRRYSHPGGVTINLAGSIFAISYLGVLSCFLIQLYMAYGVMALLSVVIVTKMCDMGAYFVGKAIGRNKMSPDLSPGKTIEGAIGGIVFACLGALILFVVAIPVVIPNYESSKNSLLYGWIIFGTIVAIVGMIGDLAGSLIKRDSNMKDSGHSIPGFGGVLDVFDSLLMAAPAAYFLWTFGIVGSAG
ncbi:MAG: phosphatidate cytidylyltransferase [Planctomycetaceae bacterium]|jgi:phosphatidate cytidylyltransferase|nr:phosphatidate cytidylyltransferase [Planctomycetaceae bacterium]